MTAPKIKENVATNIRNESVETRLDALIYRMDKTDLLVSCRQCQYLSTKSTSWAAVIIV